MEVYPKSIVLDGSKNDSRHLVRIDQFPAWLAPTSFKVFAMLIIACWKRLPNPDHKRSTGWISKNRIHFDPDRSTHYLWRLKEEIHKHFPALKDWTVYENDNRGNYRLAIKDPTIIEVEREKVVAFNDSELNSLLGGGRCGRQ